MEEWRDITGYEGLYQVSSLGNVWTLHRNRLLSQSLDSTGYLKVRLSKNGVGRTFTVHKLVAREFLPPCLEGEETRHRDGNKMDCSADNLINGTHAENMQDLLAHGGNYQAAKKFCDSGHEFTKENTQVSPSHPTWRECKQCHADKQRAKLPEIRRRRREKRLASV